MPLAARALSQICAVTAATPANAAPVAPIAAPSSSDPAAGSPAATSAAATSTARAASAPSATRSAAVSGACRPTTVAPIISARPVSSFCRVCRTTAKTFISAARTARRLKVSAVIDGAQVRFGDDPVEHPGHGAGRVRPGVGGLLALRPVEAGHAGRHQPGHRGQAEQPRRQLHAVAAQRQPRQPEGAGERLGALAGGPAAPAGGPGALGDGRGHRTASTGAASPVRSS